MAQLQVRKPDDATLAFLLGLALGVMLTLSIVELWLNNAMEHGWLMVSVANIAGIVLYYFVQPLFPEFEVLSQLFCAAAPVVLYCFVQPLFPEFEVLSQRFCAVIPDHFVVPLFPEFRGALMCVLA